MIDIHSHILPGLDDGPRTLEEALELCRAAENDGITAMAATPHSMNGKFINDADAIIGKVNELNAALEMAKINLKVYPGVDLHIYPEMLLDIKKGKALTLNKGKFVLIEFPFQSVPALALDMARKLKEEGITPVISHPERNEQFVRDFNRLEDFKDRGAILQVTAMSVTGGFGSTVRDFSLKMLKDGLIDVIATDAHSLNKRPPVLSGAVKAAAKIVGTESARRMVEDVPKEILCLT